MGLIAFAVAPATAAVSTWVAAGPTSNFSDNLNWDAPPTPDADLVFPAGAAFAAKGAPVNDLIGLDINAIYLYEAYVITGNALTLKKITNFNATDAIVALPIATFGAADLTITVNTEGTTLYLPGLMSGAGPVTYNGPGIKRLNGSVNNTLSGLTSVTEGTLVLDSDFDGVAGPIMINTGATLRILAGGIADTSAVTVDGTFDLATATGSDGPVTEVIGGLSGLGTVSLGTMVLGCTAQTAAYTNFAGNFTGSGGFRQFTSGVQVFSGNATTSTGAMTLDGGELHIWGTQLTAPVVVTDGRMVLANDCSIGALTISGAASVLSFHESITAMNLHGTATSIAMSGGSTFQVVPLGAPPTLYSNITTGSADISGASITIDTTTYAPAPGALMTIIDNTGGDPVVGTFSGFAEGAIVTAANDAAVAFRISYVGGSGNDVTLLRLITGSVRVIRIGNQPDPASWYLLPDILGTEDGDQTLFDNLPPDLDHEFAPTIPAAAG